MTIAKPKFAFSVFSFMSKLYRSPQVMKWLNEEYEEALQTLVEIDCSNETELKLIEDLLLRMKVLTSRELKLFAKNCANHICNNWMLTPGNTVITAMHNDDDPDGSELTMNYLKAQMPSTPYWKPFLFTNAEAAANAVPPDGIIVLTEDFVGTGNKVRDFICGVPANGEKERIVGLREKLDTSGKGGVEIRLVAFISLSGATGVLNTIFAENNYWLGTTETRGISDYYDSAEGQSKIDTMLTMEAKLKFSKKFTLGYEKSEALVAIEGHSSPNNLFPIFWCEKYADKTDRVSLFPRR